MRDVTRGVRAAPWSAIIGLWAISVGVLFILDTVIPDDVFDIYTPIDNHLPTLVVLVDAVFYITGGTLVLAALFKQRTDARRSINLEQIGWILTGTASIAYLTVIVIATPNWGLSITWATMVILGSAGKYHYLARLERRAEHVSDTTRQIAKIAQEAG